MLRIKILAVGNIKENYIKEGIAEYQKRLSRFASVDIKEVSECASSSKISVEKIKEVESSRLLEFCDGFVVALDRSGEEVTSEAISDLLQESCGKYGGKITFIIGGSFGFTKDVLARADKIISFGKITYPHQLIRMILMEQIYRAETIINNITYHK